MIKDDKSKKWVLPLLAKLKPVFLEGYVTRLTRHGKDAIWNWPLDKLRYYMGWFSKHLRTLVVSAPNTLARCDVPTFQKVLWLGKSKQWTQRVIWWSKKNPQNNSCDVKFWSFDRIDTQDIPRLSIRILIILRFARVKIDGLLPLQSLIESIYIESLHTRSSSQNRSIWTTACHLFGRVGPVNQQTPCLILHHRRHGQMANIIKVFCQLHLPVTTSWG